MAKVTPKVVRAIETKLIHAGEPDPLIGGAVAMPIFQSATFAYRGEQNYHDLRYIRLSNTPNHEVLHRKLAALENAEAALVAGSGMAAISTTMLALLGAGDRLLAQDCLYGGTHDLLTADLPALQIGTDFIDANDPASWREQLTERTRAIYVETISNPLMSVPDLNAVVEFAAAHGLVSIIDNTFASPVNFRPAEARLRSFAAQLHQVFERPHRYRGRRRDRAREPGAEGGAQAQPPGRRARSACLLPAASRDEDSGGARALSERERAQDRALSGSPSQGPRRSITRDSKAVPTICAPATCSTASAGC